MPTIINIPNAEILANMQSEIDALENRVDALEPVTISYTLLSSGWVNDIYTINDTKITADSIQEYLPAIDISKQQLNAIQIANVVDNGQTVGSAELKAMGTVPTIDIPIRIIFRG